MLPVPVDVAMLLQVLAAMQTLLLQLAAVTATLQHAAVPQLSTAQWLSDQAATGNVPHAVTAPLHTLRVAVAATARGKDRKQHNLRYDDDSRHHMRYDLRRACAQLPQQAPAGIVCCWVAICGQC